MNAGTKMLRSLLMAALIAGVVGVSSVAHAAANPATCVNDDDCIATPTCGGDVCDYSVQPPVCKPAGGAAKGNDGWCTTSANCKCKGVGATCTGLYCSFTKASDAPATGAGGTTGAAGTHAAGGTTGAAGTSATGAAGTTGSDGGTKPPSSGGGCSVAGSSSGGLAALVGLALVAGRLARRRRRA
jgi:hypothetical protein